MRRLEKFLPFFLFLFLVFAFFWKFFLKKLIPIPADIVAGMYYPWLDYKWGYSVGVPVKNPILTDSVSQFWVWRNLAVESFKRGEILFWNSYAGCGTPLVPLFHSALFSPLNLFYFLFSQETAMSLIVISQPLLALVFTYLFLRLFKLGKLASILGAVVFAFGGFLTVWLVWGTLSVVGSMLPAVLWGWERLVRTGRWRWFVFEILVLSFALHNAHLQTFFYLVVFWGLFVLFRLKALKGGRFKNPLLSFLAIFFSFLILNAFVILPALEVLKLSIRSVESYLPDRNYGFLPFTHLIKFLAPDFFGNHATGNYWGELNYQEFTAYFGLLPLVFVVLAVLGKKKDRVVKFFLFSGLVFLGLALKYPFGWLVYRFDLPLLSQSPASRILFLVNFCGAVLAAFGFQEFFKFPKKRFFRKTLLFFWILVLGVGSGCLMSLFWLKSYPDFNSFDNLNSWVVNLQVGLRNLFLPAAILFLTSVIFGVRSLEKGRWGRLLPFFLLILATGELFRFGFKYTPFVPRELFFPEAPILEFLKEREGVFRIERERGPLLPPNMWIPFGLQSASAYDPVLPFTYARFLQDFVGRKPTRFAELEKSNWEIFDFLNIRYFLALKYDEQMRISSEGRVFPQFEERFEPIFEDGSVVVLENKAVWPRAFLLEPGFLVNGEKLTPDFTALELLRLETDVSFKSFSDQAFEVELEAPREAVLLVTNNNFSGWQASLDGSEVEIEKSFLPFLTVLVPEGRHQVEFIYRPESFKIGLRVSLLGFFSILFWSLFLKRKRCE